MKPKFDTEQRRAIAYAAKVLLAAVDEYDHLDPAVWTRIATEKRCLVSCHNVEDGQEGAYVAPHDEDGWGVIIINRTRSRARQCAALVHELSHHIFMMITPESLFGEARVYSTNDDAANVRHRMARKVERIVFARKQS